jgi:pterin-4a-carbinolamine dehydratase
MRQLHRVYEFKSYEMAWRFMVRVDELGIRPYDHHPRWQMTSVGLKYGFVLITSDTNRQRKILNLLRYLRRFGRSLDEML